MKIVSLAITVATIYLLIYQSAPFMGISTPVIFSLFVLSPFIVIAMVYVVLKYGKPSEHTFDEQFYEDVPGESKI